MPLSWTVAHFIDENSALAGMTEDAFQAAGGEVLIQIRAVDEVSAQSIHARASYATEDIAWNAQYADVYVRDEQSGLLKIKLDEFDRVLAQTDASMRQ